MLPPSSPAPAPSGAPLRRELKGNLRDVPLSVILLAVHERRLTGELTFRRGDDAVSLELLNGEVLFANSNDPATRLGEWLLMHGKITVADYEGSVRLLKESHERQGTILLRMGLFPPLDLERYIRQQVVDLVLGLFAWPTGEYCFTPQDARVETVALDISITELIVRGIGRMQNWPLVQRGLQPYSDVLEINRKFDLVEAKRVRLSREEDAILHLVDGKRTVEDIGAASPLTPYVTFRTLFAFKAANVLRKKT